MIRDPDRLNRLLTQLYRFVQDECIPLEAEIDRTDVLPEALVARMRELGLFCHSIPEAYGGGGLTTEELACVNMVVSQAAPTFRARFGGNTGIGSEALIADGTEELPLDEDGLLAAVQDLVEQGVEAIAVCFLHSYAHPGHEQLAGELLAKHFPDLAVTTSAELVPEIKEFERTSTAVLNAYCQPVVERYLRSLAGRLRERGLGTEVFLMQSNGGLVTAAEAARHPIKILESGPASGAIAAARVGARIGVEDLITFDMGGTTAKSAVVERGEPLMTVEYELFEEPGRPGSGWPIRVPMVDIVEIGAGGGSIAWVDELGRLQVGPRSAGSESAPVCYGRGGREPTICDAHAVLGGMTSLLGGAFELQVDAARDAVRRRIAEPLGITVEEAAVGIIRIADAKVADLIREVTIARGSRLRQLAGADTITVSSYHHQAIDRLGAGLHAIACAPDGCVEAVEHGAAGVLAVQWHPEDRAASHSYDQALFDDLVARAGDSLGELGAVAGGALDDPQHRQVTAGAAGDPVDRTGHAGGRGRERGLVDALAVRGGQDRQRVGLGVGVHTDDEWVSMRDDGHSGSGPSYVGLRIRPRKAGASPGRSHSGADL